MANITLTDIKYVNLYFNNTGSASGKATSFISSLDAKTKAQSTGESASLSWGSSTVQTNNSCLGRYESRNVTTGTPHYNAELDEWECSYTASATGAVYQAHLKFNPSGLSTSAKYTLKITGGTSFLTYYACAPASNTIISDGQYYPYNSSSFSSKKDFIPNSEGSLVDITDQVKQCINTNNGVLVITPKSTTPGSTTRINQPVFTISYSGGVTACTAPSSIQDNGTGFIVPGNVVKLKWSAGGAGTNNPITGYRIYWKRGSAPVIGGADGYYDVNTVTTSVSIPAASLSNSTSSYRGETYYFKICTRGSYAVNNAFLSSISSAQTTIKVNTLPIITGVSTDRLDNAIKYSGSTTVKFTVTGDAKDTDQTLSFYYATSASGSKTKFISPLSLTINSAGTYYFWAYDGYEYSSSYQSVSITKSTQLPTATLTTLTSAPNYYDVSITGNLEDESFYNSPHNSIVSREWYLYINGVQAATLATSGTSINKSVVSNSQINFGQTYQIKVVLTDSIGDTNTLSSTTYTFPNVPAYTMSNGVDGTGTFGSILNLSYNNPSSFTLGSIKLIYKIANNVQWNDSDFILISNSNVNKADCSTLTRGSAYNFKMRFTLSNGQYNDVEYKIEDNLLTLTRAPDITPQNGSSIILIPFTKSSEEFYFECAITSSRDIKENYPVIKLRDNNDTVGTQISPSVTYRINSGNITATIEDYTVEDCDWETLIDDQLNDIYNGKIYIEVRDKFNDSFSNSFNIVYDFSNSLEASSGLNKVLYIEAGTENNYQLMNTNNYPVFQNQTYKIVLTDLKSYCNETITATVKVNKYQCSTTTFVLNQLNNGTYSTGNLNDNIIFTIPKIDTSISSTCFVLTITNESGAGSKNFNIYESEKINLCRCNTDSIDFIITKIELDGTNLNINYNVTDFGGVGIPPAKSKYSSIQLLLYYNSDGGDNYSQLNNSINIKEENGSCTYALGSVELTDEKIYIKSQITVINDFQTVNSYVPTGNSSHTRAYNTMPTFIFYNSVPNLAYGKNFFLINTTNVGTCTNQALIIRPISGRNVIYFGETGHEATITMNNNDVVLNNFTINGVISEGDIIDGGTWNLS